MQRSVNMEGEKRKVEEGNTKLNAKNSK